MESFEELGLPAELVEALASEGIERPTPLQEAAIPVLRRGNNLLLAAAPGSGTLVAWGAAALERLDPESPGPAVLVLTPTAESAQRLAESLQRLGAVTGHNVAALGSPWALPGRAHVVFGAPADVLAATAAGELELGRITLLVVDQADRIEGLGGLAAVEEVVGFLPKEGQRVVLALPVTPGVEDLVERHARRAATIPPRAADGSLERTSVQRGTLQFRIVPEPKEEGLLATVAELLADAARHVLVFCRSEDRAADVGDYLTLHGYLAGAPGDMGAPVWLGVQELEARSAATGVDGVAVVSYDVPADPDSLDRRHGLQGRGTVILAAREISHFRDIARRTGYALEPSPLPARKEDEASRFRNMLTKALEQEDVSPYLLLLEPLFERFDAAEVAAAAVSLLRKKAPAPQPPPYSTSTGAAAREAPTAWVKLFLTVGERDGLSAKDLLGAITGEANIPGSKVGKIDIKESHTIVEVVEPVARKVISALNGTTIRGRSIRADFDRPKSRGPGAGGRSGPPRGRPPRPS
ncbi:MAG: DEAD/DEAH box helicase [Longimicrobiales bacterium]|nr:DEAD/DEAH box helicase [Longimicrobiales bacterium]